MNSSVSICSAGIARWSASPTKRSRSAYASFFASMRRWRYGAEFCPSDFRSYGSRMRSISSTAIPWLLGGSSQTRYPLNGTEIGVREEAAHRLHTRDQRPPDRAAVERSDPVVRDRLERARVVRIPERLPLGRSMAARKERRRRTGVALQELRL